MGLGAIELNWEGYHCFLPTAGSMSPESYANLGGGRALSTSKDHGI